MEYARKYFELKYERIPNIKEYVNVLLTEGFRPRKIDTILQILANNMNKTLIISLASIETANKLYEIKGV